MVGYVCGVNLINLLLCQKFSQQQGKYVKGSNANKIWHWIQWKNAYFYIYN